MTELERFLAVVRFEKPDYWPVLAAHALSYPHAGAMPKLHAEGLPQWVNDIDAWCRYWGQFTYLKAELIGADLPTIKTETWTEGEYEFVRSETGALTRQVVGNDLMYSMPDFIEFDVRDRAGWRRFRDLSTPRGVADVEAQAGRLDGRTRPAAVHGGSTWGAVRNWMGPHRALLAIHDEPDLLVEMMEWQRWMFDTFTVPVLQRYRPEIVTWWEDFCFNHGMMISPAAFREFCAANYRHVAEAARDCGAELFLVDTDGHVGEYLSLLEEVGFNGCCPMEQVCGNDLPALRREHPRLVFAGGIEKFVVATGQGGRIDEEIVPKVPQMLATGGYFPAFDHGLPTTTGFREHCRAMTVLHAVCDGEHLGEFPRVHETM